jgi:hypothetical protein
MVDHKKPGVAFWATVALVVVLVGYPLSFGPACWATNRHWQYLPLTANAYRPLVRLAMEGPDWVSRPLCRWASVGTDHPRTEEPTIVVALFVNL